MYNDSLREQANLYASCMAVYAVTVGYFEPQTMIKKLKSPTGIFYIAGCAFLTPQNLGI